MLCSGGGVLCPLWPVLLAASIHYNTSIISVLVHISQEKLNISWWCCFLRRFHKSDNYSLLCLVTMLWEQCLILAPSTHFQFKWLSACFLDWTLWTCVWTKSVCHTVQWCVVLTFCGAENTLTLAFIKFTSAKRPESSSRVTPDLETTNGPLQCSWAAALQSWRSIIK